MNSLITALRGLSVCSSALTKTKLNGQLIVSAAKLHTASQLNHSWTLHEYRKGAPKRDDGTASLPADQFFEKYCEFPSVDTFKTLYDGVPYEKLPILYIQCTKNNTKLQLKTWQRKELRRKSCYTEGFKNAAKNTTVAATAACVAMCRIIKFRKLTTLRLCIRGLAIGRMVAVQTLEKEGINVVSITDRADYNIVKGHRTKKVRRV